MSGQYVALYQAAFNTVDDEIWILRLRMRVTY